MSEQETFKYLSNYHRSIMDNMWIQINLKTGEVKTVVSGQAAEILQEYEKFNPNDQKLISY